MADNAATLIEVENFLLGGRPDFRISGAFDKIIFDPSWIIIRLATASRFSF